MRVDFTNKAQKQMQTAGKLNLDAGTQITTSLSKIITTQFKWYKWYLNALIPELSASDIFLGRSSAAPYTISFLTIFFGLYTNR